MLVKPFYEILDNEADRPYGLRLTTLSKILHRKRPEFLVLYDKWVKACFLGENGPVTVVKNRATSDYMVAISLAIRDNLASQIELFDEIQAVIPSAAGVSHVRLLDILAWSSRGKPGD